MSFLNKARARRAAKAVDAYSAAAQRSADNSTKTEIVTDLVADLLHYCAANNITEDVLRLGRVHYDAERGKPEGIVS